MIVQTPQLRRPRSHSDLGSRFSPSRDRQAVVRKFPFHVDHVISPAECATVVRKIDSLRDHWISRDGIGMFTLGAAAYLDAPDPKSMRAYGMKRATDEPYEALVDRLNPILLENFADLYMRVADQLAEEFQVSVSYRDGLALPGFHVFTESAFYAKQANHVPHFDRPFTTLNWGNDAGHLDFRRSLSFTLTLALPAAGGGLKTWDVSYDDVTSVSPGEAKKRITESKLTTLPYSIGGMICQTGNELHQIAPWQASPGDRRITLQGHGLFHEESVFLYW